MRQPYLVNQKDRSDPRTHASKGFVLLEVLVAMSLILGAWMALVGTYQSLALRTTQAESKRAGLRKQLDTFEIGEQARAISKVNIKGPIHESSRVSSRNRAKPVTSQSPAKNKR
jgi:prepilin-type N-terminal cleavage/methylation domain-containing protein